jgi:hypothetical protein
MFSHSDLFQNVYKITVLERIITHSEGYLQSVIGSSIIKVTINFDYRYSVKLTIREHEIFYCWAALRIDNDTIGTKKSVISTKMGSS